MAFYGVSLDVTIQKLNFEFRLALKKKGGLGIRSLARIFKQFDVNGNKKLDIKEFEAALAQVGIFPSKTDFQALLGYYDLDHDGNITYEEFIKGLREPLTARRAALVAKIFALLDKNGSGTITAVDVEKMYNVQKHKDFISGKKTKAELLAEFLANFEGPRGTKDGTITKDEFMEYYTDLSMIIPSDEYFVALLESVWMVTEKDDSSKKDKAIALIKTLIEKLKEIVGPLDDKIIPKVFKEFNTSKTGGMTIDEVYAMFMKIGISTERSYMTDIVRLFDRNQSGTIEFDEFQSSLKSFL